MHRLNPKRRVPLPHSRSVSRQRLRRSVPGRAKWLRSRPSSEPLSARPSRKGWRTRCAIASRSDSRKPQPRESSLTPEQRTAVRNAIRARLADDVREGLAEKLSARLSERLGTDVPLRAGTLTPEQRSRAPQRHQREAWR